MSFQLGTAMVTREVTVADAAEDPLGVPLDRAGPGVLPLPLRIPLTARHPVTPALQSETCYLIWVSQNTIIS